MQICIDVGAVFDIKMVGFLVSAVGYQASKQASKNGPCVLWAQEIYGCCCSLGVEVRS